MVNVIDLLEESGYIVRRRNPADRREYALQLTAKGRALYARAEKAILEAERQTARRLTATEARTLMDLLERIAADEPA
jgi:DNA-binding MarR family transcriptional regulator